MNRSTEVPYLPPSTVAESLAAIQSGALVLPAIQREFVWQPAQVTALFDSVMRGYPIGSFLSWEVGRDTARQFKFYGFVKDYSEFNQRHNPVLDIPADHAITAVLDGQQRLTSLNIGLRGTYAWKRKYGWAQFIENYPPRTLHLNVASKASENAAGLEYDFRFLTAEQLEAMGPDEARYWLPVPSIGQASKVKEIMIELGRREIANDETALEFATDLWEKIHSEKSIYFYQETDQDIERVLDIFIRVNSGGSPLSYSDLLLSIATAQWKDRDARQEVHDLVDTINATGAGFRFTQDLVLKAGLVLAGVSDIGFKVKNFTAENMELLAAKWDEIGAALRVSAALLGDFGLSGANLTARSVLIPVAAYVHRRKLTQAYRDSPSEAHDRQELRSWILRSLIVPGVWGSGLDVLLRALREVINQDGGSAFPTVEIERAMSARGKSLTITEEVVDGLLSRQYGDAATFALLAIAFPHVNTRNVHHVDHVFPISKLSATEIKKANLTQADVDTINEMKNSVVNLQLLEGPENISKSAKMPAAWAAATFPDADALSGYLERNVLPTLPPTIGEFPAFATARKKLLHDRFIRALTATTDQVSSDAEIVAVPPIDESPEAEVSEP
jgi:hypothetical protein